MKLLLIFFVFILFAGTGSPAYAGCYRQITQCIYVDSEVSINYNGLCIAASCGNVHDAFNNLEFPDGNQVSVVFSKDGNRLPRPETDGVLSPLLDTVRVSGLLKPMRGRFT